MARPRKYATTSEAEIRALAMYSLMTLLRTRSSSSLNRIAAH